MFRPALRLRIDELRVPAAELRPDTLAATVPTAPDYASPSWKNFSVDGQAEAVIVAGQPTLSLFHLVGQPMRMRA